MINAKNPLAFEKRQQTKTKKQKQNPKVFKSPLVTNKKLVELVENTVQFQLLQPRLPMPAQAGRKVLSRAKQGGLWVFFLLISPNTKC